MGDIYETHAPGQFSAISDQPIPEPEPMEGGGQNIPTVKETADRWRKEVVEKIDGLRKKLIQVHLENEALIQDVTKFKAELTAAQSKVNGLELQMAETWQIFNQTLFEINQSLATAPGPHDGVEGGSPRPIFGEPASPERP